MLVVGGSVAGEGFEQLLDDPALELVETDVALGPRTSLVCDAHDLPFADGTFDAVVCQAVLEHVADPPRVVTELRRVLRPGGLAYSEIPFMQQVHEGAHDFTRYTLTGHRRLFRDFAELGSGAVAGPGMALGWSVRAFGLGLVGSRPAARDGGQRADDAGAVVAQGARPVPAPGPGGPGRRRRDLVPRPARRAPRSDRDVLAAHRGANAGFSLDRS